MKTLYLLRHAKSDWHAEFETDFERPLSSRGRRAAKATGALLAKSRTKPDLILCSSAVRTRATLDLILKVSDWDSDVETLDELYTGNPKHVLKVVTGIAKSVRSAMVVGHETAMSETMSTLIGQAQSKFPTAAVAGIQLEVKRWGEVGAGCGRLLLFVPPRLLT